MSHRSRTSRRSAGGSMRRCGTQRLQWWGHGSPPPVTTSMGAHTTRSPGSASSSEETRGFLACLTLFVVHCGFSRNPQTNLCMELQSHACTRHAAHPVYWVVSLHGCFTVVFRRLREAQGGRCCLLQRSVERVVYCENVAKDGIGLELVFNAVEPVGVVVRRRVEVLLAQWRVDVARDPDRFHLADRFCPTPQS